MDTAKISKGRRLIPIQGPSHHQQSYASASFHHRERLLLDVTPVAIFHRPGLLQGPSVDRSDSACTSCRPPFFPRWFQYANVTPRTNKDGGGDRIVRSIASSGGAFVGVDLDCGRRPCASGITLKALFSGSLSSRRQRCFPCFWSLYTKLHDVCCWLY